jgi:hypothetical protein
MHSSKSFTTALLAGARFAMADSYANDQSPTVVDSSQVANDFLAVDGITLLSPAFVNPQGVPATFGNGTSGPTPLIVLGK